MASYSVKDLAERWGYSERHIWRLISSGEIKSYRERYGLKDWRRVISDKEVKRLERMMEKGTG